MSPEKNTDRDRRSPAKRRAILDAALRLFLEQGYARVSVDTIAAAAGVGKQTVYSHFGQKEALFLAAIRAARSASPQPPVTAVPDTGDPVADLTAAVEALLDKVLSPTLSALHRLTIAELPHHHELQRFWRDDDQSTPEESALADYLGRCDKAGTLNVPDAHLAARQLILLAVTEARIATLYGTEPLDASRRRTIAEQASDLIVRGHQQR